MQNDSISKFAPMTLATMAGDAVREQAKYVTSDNKPHDTADQAVRWESAIIFRTWCDNRFRGGEYSPEMIADAVLEAWDLSDIRALKLGVAS